MAESVDFTIALEGPDEDGWLVARVLEVPAALSQGRTREEARENVLDALRTVLTPDEEPADSCSKAGGAKHTKWRGPGGQLACVPDQEEIGPGLTRAICEQLGVESPTRPG